MHAIMIRLFLLLWLCLPALAGAVATTQSIHVEWGYTPPSEPAVTGFKLYQEGIFVCQTNDPAATAMDCQVTLTSETTNFTLTATFSDNTESPHSAPFAFSLNGQPTTPLAAAISTGNLTGAAPLTVEFNGSASTGSITGYLWDFGDGTTAATATASHVFTAPGSYVVKLTVTDAASATSEATVTVTASATGGTTTNQPTAILSSSTAAGPAPLSVAFDGSGSTVADATIASHAWNFGDGSESSGAQVTHIYPTSGTYTATLTVTASNGLSDSISTPIVVSTPTSNNTPPTAAASATPTSGTNPLPVNFNASASTDPDGSIVAYEWNFGDGSSASGKTATHLYGTAASYTATLVVTDNQGAKKAKSIPITVQTATSKTPTSQNATAVSQPKAHAATVVVIISQLLLQDAEKKKTTENQQQ